VARLNLSAAEQETLATALRRGDRGAFEELYAALHPSIYSFAARLLDDSEEAKDVTQEVFLAAYRDLPRHRGALRVEPWLFRVTMNACYDRLRARARRADTPLEEVSTLVDPRNGYDQAAMAAAVEEALRDMSPRYRVALILHDVQGLNRRELSEAMGVTWGTAGVLLFRARTAFKKRLTALLPAGGSVAALALLPALPVPSALQTAPVFGSPAAAAPVVAPLAAAPAAMPAAAPLLGLAHVGGVLGTKVALVAAGILAMASGFAVQEAVTDDASFVPAKAPALVQSASAGSGRDDGKSLQSHWPGHVPQHKQRLSAGAPGGSSSSGPSSEPSGTTVRVNEGTAAAGETSAAAGETSPAAAEQQAGDVESAAGSSSSDGGSSGGATTDTTTGSKTSDRSVRSE
jgi:RNA polymerase sigma-70 factor, ECF subfamily